jgi:hypothetical protein
MGKFFPPAPYIHPSIGDEFERIASARDSRTIFESQYDPIGGS